MSVPLGCVTGRFQPVHEQHLELFAIALAECEHLVVAVTNPDSGARRAESTSAHRHLAEANPFTYYERVRLLEAALGAGGRVSIVPFDLTRPELWSEYVPLSARQYVRAYGDWERAKAGQLTRGGYAVTVLEGEATRRVSGTDVRARLRSGDPGWRSLVPPATVAILERSLGGL